MLTGFYYYYYYNVLIELPGPIKQLPACGSATSGLSMSL
jgi:hypothetical protein